MSLLRMVARRIKARTESRADYAEHTPALRSALDELALNKRLFVLRDRLQEHSEKSALNRSEPDFEAVLDSYVKHEFGCRRIALGFARNHAATSFLKEALTLCGQFQQWHKERIPTS